MAVLTGRVYVPAPNPLVPRSGLFQVATGPLDLPVHARIGGLEWWTSTCDLPACYEVECQADHNTKTLTGALTTITGNPFVVYSSKQCSPVGLTDPDLKKYLYDKLVAGEQATVESTFSTQACGQAPGLSNNAAVVTLAGTLDLTAAISAAEAWLYARYGLPGVLHIPAVLGAYLSYMHLIEKDSRGIWRTAMGTAVSIGNYAGNAPGGAAPAAGTSWIYITGEVAVYRTSDSALFATTRAETLTRTTNVINAVMEREYVVSFDCHVAGQLVDITGVVA